MIIPIMKPSLPPFDRIEGKLREIFETGIITSGKYVEAFERNCAEYLGAPYAVAVSSGTMALIAAVMCLDLKGQVILPSFTWCASAHALLWNGLEPVFVDIEPDSFNINPDEVRNAITPQTSAIMAVHMFGNPCNVEALQEIADTHGLKLIYDCAHAFGSRYKNKQMGGLGTCGAFSLSPTKTITTAEGGIVTTNDANLANKLVLFRNQGVVDYDATFCGLNARQSELHAILGLEMIGMADELVEKKQKLLAHYIPELQKIPGISLQTIRENSISSYKDFNIIVDAKLFGGDRDQLEGILNKNGIATKKYYYPPVHRQKAYKYLFDKYDEKLKFTNQVSDNTLTIPLYPDMPLEYVDKVLAAIWSAYRDNNKNI
jgi:dTDP-4-amino-4,6-dideoxygalactose transaminase